MDIALTGSSGFIGQALLRGYSDAHRFLAFTSDPDAPGLFRHPNIVYVQVTRAADGGAPAFPTWPHACDAAVNLGFRRPVVGKRDAITDYLGSIAASDAFFQSCVDNGISNIVHVSSRSVYSKETPVPHAETEPAAPFSPYGAAKLAAEACAAARDSQDGTCIKTLRFAQVVGVNEYQGVVSVYLKAARRGKPLSIWGTGHESAREYLYVRDATAAIMAALGHPQAKGVFNIGTGQANDAASLIGCLDDIVGGTLRVSYAPEKQVEALDYCMDVARAREVLGWEAAWDIRDTLRAMYDDTEGLF